METAHTHQRMARAFRCMEIRLGSGACCPRGKHWEILSTAHKFSRAGRASELLLADMIVSNHSGYLTKPTTFRVVES